MSINEARLVAESDPRTFSVVMRRSIPSLQELSIASISDMDVLHDDRMWLLFRNPDEIFGEISDDPSDLCDERRELLNEYVRNAARLRTRRNIVVAMMDANPLIGLSDREDIFFRLERIERCILAVRDEIHVDLFEGEIRDELADRNELSDTWELSHLMYATCSAILRSIELQWDPSSGGSKRAG
jgi:hypothetical protein